MRNEVVKRTDMEAILASTSWPFLPVQFLVWGLSIVIEAWTEIIWFALRQAFRLPVAGYRFLQPVVAALFFWTRAVVSLCWLVGHKDKKYTFGRAILRPEEVLRFPNGYTAATCAICGRIEEKSL